MSAEAKALADEARARAAALNDQVRASWAAEDELLEDAEAATAPDNATSKPTPSARLVVRSLADVQSQPVDWLWHRWLPRGKFMLVGGHAGDGKSTLLAALAAIGSRGGEWPDGARAPRPLRTLFILGEDSAADTLKPRLELHGAAMDQGQISVMEMVLDEKGRERFFNVAKHLDLLEATIVAERLDWIVIDPLTTIMPGSDRNAEGDTRDALTPLIKLAERHHVTVTGVVHVGKAEGSRRAAQKILGATAFHALARVVWMIAPDQDGRMVLGVVKSNLAITPPSLMWSREENGPISWEGVSPQDVEELLSAPMPVNQRADAEGFLRELLAGGSRASDDIQQAAREHRLAWRTVRRAADALQVLKFKEPGRLNGRWFWRLPGGEPAYTDAPDTPKLATPDTDGQLREDAKLATPRDSQLANFGKFEDGHVPNNGHLHETTPLFVVAEVGHDDHDDSQIPEVGQPTFFRGGQLRADNEGRPANASDNTLIIEIAKRIATFTEAEREIYRAELDTAPADDPSAAIERAALNLADTALAAGVRP